MIYLLFLAGFLLSATAAYYSIVGLIAIFPGAAVAIIAMGSTLEFAKLVAASWLYRSWHLAPRFLKYYLSAAVLTLMFITSMGIFGFLSKAHIESSTPTADISAQIELLDEKILLRRENIEAEKKNIETARTAISQLDAQVTSRMGILSSEDAAAGVRLRRDQKTERESLARDIQTAQSKIETYNNEVAALTEEKLHLASDLRKIEVEVGPLKYIAELIYGDEAKDHFDSAVRAVIILLVLVFDPLAVFLLLAANVTLIQNRKDIDKPVITGYNKDSDTYNFIMGDDHNIKPVDEKVVDRKRVWMPSRLRKK